MKKSWLGTAKPPKNPHSLEHLKYLHHILTKNHTITEGNKSLIVEALRSMAEILIWGDQNDSSVFEFYLEKNMFLFFLNILQQNSGNYVCVQLLQTLNILFENLQNDTSLYYMLSNNHVNEVITHKFDFSDEEVLAYYISFLKTLSLKLNVHTIHFFYNEHADDFALYTEAIKFFNHSESMVRIAVRTISLNVYKVQDEAMLRFVIDRTAAPYFSNLVWFIGNHVKEINNCLRDTASHHNKSRLSDLVAEHLDHLHYINDILIINNETLNVVVTDHLLNRLLVPLYIFSLTSIGEGEDTADSRIESSLALFLLSQVFLIIHDKNLVHRLARVIFNENPITATASAGKSPVYKLMEQPESLEKLLEARKNKKSIKVKRPNFRNVDSDEEDSHVIIEQTNTIAEVVKGAEDQLYSDEDIEEEGVPVGGTMPQSNNSTDEEKAAMINKTPMNRPLLDTIYSALNCTDGDYTALFSMCLIHAVIDNQGIKNNLKSIVTLKDSTTPETYSHWLVERLIRILTNSIKADSKIRLVSLQLSCLLLKQMGMKEGKCILLQSHLAAIEEEEIFLDIFEDEYRTMQTKPLNVQFVMMDSSLLLPPTSTPLTGIEFIKRLPCGPTEQARRAIGQFFVLRELSLALCNELETQLPLTRDQDCIQNNDKLDLNNSDLIACTVAKDDGRQRRFLVVDLYQLILVEPDNKRLGWGVVRFAGFLQDIEVTNDSEDSRILHVTIHKPSGTRRVPLLSADFVFNDHIRCMAAKQRLTKGRLRARHLKMQRIAVLIGLPADANEDAFTTSYMLNTAYQNPQTNFRAYASPQALESSPSLDGKPHPASPHHPQPILKRPGKAFGSAVRLGSLGLPVKVTTKNNPESPQQGETSAQPSMTPNTHRRTPSGHISSQLLPQEEIGIQVISSSTVSTEDGKTGLEEGVDASSLDEFSLDEGYGGSIFPTDSKDNDVANYETDDSKAAKLKSNENEQSSSN